MKELGFERKYYHGEKKTVDEQLLERMEQGDAVELVGMGQEKLIEVLPGDSKEKIIWTRALQGCYAPIVFTEHEDGTRNAALAHYLTYPPEIFEEQLTKLHQLLARYPKMGAALIKEVVLLMPDTYEEEFSASLTETTRAAVSVGLNGADTKLRVEKYSMMPTGEKDQGTLVVIVPPNSQGKASYKTWFSEGAF